MKITFCPRCGTRFVCPNYGPDGYICFCTPLAKVRGHLMAPCMWGDFTYLWEHSAPTYGDNEQ